MQCRSSVSPFHPVLRDEVSRPTPLQSPLTRDVSPLKLLHVACFKRAATAVCWKVMWWLRCGSGMTLLWYWSVTVTVAAPSNLKSWMTRFQSSREKSDLLHGSFWATTCFSNSDDRSRALKCFSLHVSFKDMFLMDFFSFSSVVLSCLQNEDSMCWAP